MEREKVETDGEEEDISVRPVNMISCRKCRKRYRQEEYFGKYVENCDSKNED